MTGPFGEILFVIITNIKCVTINLNKNCVVLIVIYEHLKKCEMRDNNTKRLTIIFLRVMTLFWRVGRVRNDNVNIYNVF